MERLDRKHEYNVAIDELECGPSDVPECFGRGAAPIHCAPLIDAFLDLGGIPSHHGVDLDREQARLSDQLVVTPAMAGPESGAPFFGLSVQKCSVSNPEKSAGSFRQPG